VLEDLNKVGLSGMVRMNWLNKPFDNVKIRQAVLYAVNQAGLLQAQIGNPKYFQGLLGAVRLRHAGWRQRRGAEKPISEGEALLKEGATTHAGRHHGSRPISDRGAAWPRHRRGAEGDRS